MPILAMILLIPDSAATNSCTITHAAAAPATSRSPHSPSRFRTQQRHTTRPNALIEHRPGNWAYAPAPASQQRFARELGHLAMTEVPTIPLGQQYERTAFRKSITGILSGVASYPWNVRPV